jgi:hypothetical protein
MKYYVSIEGQKLEVFDAPDVALGFAKTQVYLSPERYNTGLGLLKAGKIFNYSYGFKSVDIIPKVK